MASLDDLRAYLDTLVDRHEQPAFIDGDPISIPHAFDDPRDQAVIGTTRPYWRGDGAT